MIPPYYISILAALWGTLNALPDIYAAELTVFSVNSSPG